MPIHYAAESTSIEAMEILLDAGAETEAVNKEGRTPIMILGTLYTLSDDMIKAIKLLITRGADPFKRFSSPQEFIDFFDGDIDWMPDGDLKRKLQLMKRSKKMFGV